MELRENLFEIQVLGKEWQLNYTDTKGEWLILGNS